MEVLLLNGIFKATSSISESSLEEFKPYEPPLEAAVDGGRPYTLARYPSFCMTYRE